MCNLYRLDAPANPIALAMRADRNGDQWPGDYVAPMRVAPVVVSDRSMMTGRKLQGMIWGIAPPATGRLAGGKHITNVRNLDSPFWIGSLKNPGTRCIIPATCFQEWSKAPVTAMGKKVPHWFSVPSQPIFGLAGIWRDNGEAPFFAMLTTDANQLVGEIHPKAMPVILHREEYDVWLRADWKEAKELASPFPSQLMRVALHPPGHADAAPSQPDSQPGLF